MVVVSAAQSPADESVDEDNAGLLSAYHSLTGQKGNMNVQSRTVEIRI